MFSHSQKHRYLDVGCSQFFPQKFPSILRRVDHPSGKSSVTNHNQKKKVMFSVTGLILFFSVAVTTGTLAQFEVGQQSATKITTNLEHEAPAGYKFSIHRSTEFKWNVDLVSETHLGIEENCKRPREKEDGMVTMAMSEAMAQLRLPRTWPTKAMR